MSPSRSLGKKTKQLRSKGGDAVIVTSLEGLGALLDADGESVDADRSGSVRSAMKVCDAAVVLADTQPVIGIPGTSLGIMGKRVDALDADGVRAVACGVMGRMACWSEASAAALAGLHVTSAAVEAWLEQRKGRGGPLAEEMAEGIPGVM